MRLVVRGRRVVLPDGERAAAIHIDEGTIVAIGDYADTAGASQVVDADHLVLSPGVVDPHVHINEPGRTEWEGFDTATRAAAAGGVTTVVDMPLNSVPATVSTDALAAKRGAATGRCHVDVGFWGGIVPGNAGDIGPLIEAGVRGFKAFLVPSGVDEFPNVNAADLRLALPELARAGHAAVPLLVHAELPSHLRAPAGDGREFATYLATRPAVAEAAAVAMMSGLSREYDVPVHIVHLSSADGVATVGAAQAIGTRMTAETCPHYLTFTSGDVPAGATAFKCAPPIRESEHRDALWTALSHGAIGMIASDHSPAPASMKQAETGDVMAAWGGIASLELSLAAAWTGASKRGFGVSDIARWMSEQSARLCGLHHRKGAIRVGNDADLVLWDPDARFEVRAERLQQRHKLTPYAGLSLRGVVHTTFVRGMRVWDAGLLALPGRGLLL